MAEQKDNNTVIMGIHPGLDNSSAGVFVNDADRDSARAVD